MKRSAILTSLITAIVFSADTQLAFAQIVEVPTLGGVSSSAEVWLQIDRSRREVSLYRGNIRVGRYRVAIGRPGWETPPGEFHVFQMRRNPAWQHPLSDEVFPAGHRQNELGHYWIGFCSKEEGLIGFHDTPHPETVGQAVSHGCVRMFEKDIAKLFREVRLGTLVAVLP